MTAARSRRTDRLLPDQRLRPSRIGLVELACLLLLAGGAFVAV